MAIPPMNRLSTSSRPVVVHKLVAYWSVPVKWRIVSGKTGKRAGVSMRGKAKSGQLWRVTHFERANF